MLTQSFKSQHEQKYQPKDRFIPHRHQANRHQAYYIQTQLEDQDEKDILTQNISSFFLHEYSSYLERALNLRNMHARFLFSSPAQPPEKQSEQAYHWPVRCRKFPLIRQPYQLLDLPNFRSNFFLNQLDWAPSKYLAASLQNSVYLYQDGDAPMELLEVEFGYCSALKWNPGGDKLIIGTTNSVIQVWNAQEKKMEEETLCKCSRIDRCTINVLVWHPNKEICVSGCSYGTLKLLYLPFTQYQHKHKCISHAHEGQIITLKSCPDGNFLASSGEDGAVRIWKWPNLTPHMEITSFMDQIRALAWHPWKTSYLVIGGCFSGSISLWNVSKGTQEGYQKLQSASVFSLEWSPITGELVAGIFVSDDDDGELMGRTALVVLKSLNKIVDRMECVAGLVKYLLWCPDGKKIATVGSDETLRIWYFFGPSTMRVKNVSQFLKPMVPSGFTMSPYGNRTFQYYVSNTQETNKTKKKSNLLQDEDLCYDMLDSSFGLHHLI